MAVSNRSSSSSVVGGSSEMDVTAAAWMPEGEVGYPAVRMESSWFVRMSMMSKSYCVVVVVRDVYIEVEADVVM